MDRGSLVQPVDCREHSDLNGLNKVLRITVACGGGAEVHTTQIPTKRRMCNGLGTF